MTAIRTATRSAPAQGDRTNGLGRSLLPLVLPARPLRFLCALVVLCSTGCSRGPEFAEVEGVVTLDGKPLDSVEVLFLPDPEKGNTGPHAKAYTDAQGRYKLRCEKADKGGTVLGPHRVCLIDLTAVTMPLTGMRPPPAVRAQLSDVLPAAPAPAKPKAVRVPTAYGNPAQTPLHVEVKSGRQEFNFDIPSGKRK
jgi:hypothetical protein